MATAEALALSWREDPESQDGTVRATCGAFTVLIAELGTNPLEAERVWSQHQRSAAVTRASLPPASNEDVVLYLVGPVGSINEPEWRTFGMQVERNDLVCRKLVWLPPADTAQRESSIVEFCRRTFLSRPWSGPVERVQPQLDALSGAASSFDDWEEILAKHVSNPDYGALIDELFSLSK
jgi:hypothetical protein